MRTFFSLRFFAAAITAVTSLAACGNDAPDVCAGYAGTCLDLTVRSSEITSIDTLQVDASGAVTGPRTSTLGKSATLPVHVALQLPTGTAGSLSLTVTGRLNATNVGSGTVTVTLVANKRNAATVELRAAVAPDLGGVDLVGADLAGADLTTPPDLVMPSDDGSTAPDLTDVPDLAPFCVAGTPHACADSANLETCNATGTAYETTTCARGCGDTPTPHCKLVVPTGNAQNSDITVAGLQDKTLNNAIMHSDTGEIEGGIRAAAGDPTALTVTSGIGFHVVNVGGNNVGIFLFDNLTITGTLRVVGTHPVAILARGTVNATTINVAADQSANTPGPGGYAGGNTTSHDGLGPGGGKGGFISTFKGGGGGGGHGAAGGVGGTVSSATGGAAGASYDSATLVTLRGGSGGGAGGGVEAGGNGNGGAGGGAIQIVAQTSITITNGIAAGGAGGRGGNGSSGGGGAGGAILLEAPTVTLSADGFLVAGGGGGGGATSNGNAAGNSNLEVSVGLGGFCSSRCGGQGAYSNVATYSGGGGPGTPDGMQAGGGGGALGWIRVNSLTGSAALATGGNTLYVPPMSLNRFSQGVITIQ